MTRRPASKQLLSSLLMMSGLPTSHVQADQGRRGVELRSKAEIVEVEIPQEASQPEHSWKRFAGMVEDEPLFDEAL